MSPSIPLTDPRQGDEDWTPSKAVPAERGLYDRGLDRNASSEAKRSSGQIYALPRPMDPRRTTCGCRREQVDKQDGPGRETSPDRDLDRST
jgi:hypothetical protein